jgi:ribosomal protein L11 methyltransferase
MMQADYENNDLGISCPYEDLYIYLLQGKVEELYGQDLGRSFIGNWEEDNSSFLFFSRPAQQEIELLLKRKEDLVLLDDYKFSYEEWQGGGLEPIKIDRFLVCPPWSKVDTDKNEIRIILDPGVVFGNGLHPTTRDCLRALSYAAKDQIFTNLLDLGTGTGILALAAARIGARTVIAVDLNPLCVKTAEKNVRLNNLENIIQVVKGRAEDFLEQDADLVVANIHHKVVADLLKEKAFRKNKRFILSGLMRSQAREIKAEMNKYGMFLLKEWDYEMTWYTMLFRS